MKNYLDKIVSWEALKQEVDRLREHGNRIVFTNGCFDILHAGHVHLFNEVHKLGDVVIVAVNSDESVQRNKGPERPINSEQDRAEVLAGLQSIDYVTVFGEETPHKILELVHPDVLAKGGDWGQVIIGREIVEAYGGDIVSIPIREGRSTTNVVEKIQQQSK